MPGFELVGKEELKQIEEVFDRGAILFRHGFDHLRDGCYKTKEFETAFAKKMNIDHALAVSSGTAALRVALAALDINKGDEVITQTFTFVATVEAIIESRAIPVCADIDLTLNLCPDSLLESITPKTKAVIVVHMLGTPARIDIISEICASRGIALIEDTAWGCGGSLNGKKLGTWGDIGTFSFDFAKTMTTGEGGMLVCKDKSIFEKASAWHDHGHENNPKVPRWEDTRSSSGFNYRMMELQGAIGLAQLDKLDEVIEAQRKNRDLIWNEIKYLDGVILRELLSGSYETADALVFFLPDKECAKKCRENLLLDDLGTKILPEAYSWHFAGTWDHMPELKKRHNGNLVLAFQKSESILQRAVALPISTIALDNTVPGRIKSAIEQAL
jgi:8-amino-3,8-dideoxy-alpha-D-manno-octulosonate transaminase